ncbi:MAG: 30S ribosomal protein S3 [candidate division Zixibacteria bacterium SM23_73_3]|nr:MAG: 30S ribosomal protein S3 [candidate division Zixibacteria bacterium SM23_73_3]
MGQKTNPIGLRLGIIKTWTSRWFSDRKFSDFLKEDLIIRRYTEKRLEHAGIAAIDIIRAPRKVTLDIHTARPGIVIGRRGAEVDKLKEELQLLTKKEIAINIIEVKKPELSAKLVAESIAKQLEGRVSFRRAMKKSITSTMKMGAQGVKISCGGRLAGAEIARTEKYMEGRVPLHTLRADIDYATATAHTTYGCIGVKVWIFKGEILGSKDEISPKEEVSARETSKGLKPGEDKRKKGERKRRRKRVKKGE